MPKRIPTDTIVLYREGKQVVPEVGKEFDFTADELASINKSHPNALAKVGEKVVEPAPVDGAEKVKAK